MSRIYHGYGQGRIDVFPFKLKDFNEMVRLTLVYRDRAINKPKKYYMWYRNYIMLILGVNTGCRIETLLQLTPKHIEGGCVRIKEFKTNKVQRYEFSEKVYKEIKNFIDLYNIGDREYIFRKSVSDIKPITRVQAYRIIQDLKKDVGFTYNVGCHSLRKSYGRFLYDQTHDIHLVQRMLSHSNPLVTQQYICLEDDKVAKYKKSSEWGLNG